MRPPHAVICAVVAASIGAGISLHAFQTAPAKPDPIIGIWQLNAAKSNYFPGPGPISETRTYKRGPNGVEGTIERRLPAAGPSASSTWPSDDREYPVSGTRSTTTSC